VTTRPEAAERWATFDCYGTLVDWNAGIGAELARRLGPAPEALLPERYHAIEPRIQRERPATAYRDVMASVLAELAAEEGVDLPASEHDALGRSPAPTRERADLAGLADVLDELVAP
jgi:2-haloacid dehalogenase